MRPHKALASVDLVVFPHEQIEKCTCLISRGGEVGVATAQRVVDELGANVLWATEEYARELVKRKRRRRSVISRLGKF